MSEACEAGSAPCPEKVVATYGGMPICAKHIVRIMQVAAANGGPTEWKLVKAEGVLSDE